MFQSALRGGDFVACHDYVNERRRFISQLESVALFELLYSNRTWDDAVLDDARGLSDRSDEPQSSTSTAFEYHLIQLWVNKTSVSQQKRPRLIKSLDVRGHQNIVSDMCELLWVTCA